MTGRDEYGWKWLQMAGNGWNGWKWLKMARMAGYG